MSPVLSRLRRTVLAAAILGAASLALQPAPLQAQAASRAPAAAVVDTSGPTQLIESAANAMLGELDARRAEFRKDPRKLEALVERFLLPYFDILNFSRNKKSLRFMHLCFSMELSHKHRLTQPDRTFRFLLAWDYLPLPTLSTSAKSRQKLRQSC
jgi:hypothetical protein